MADVLKGTIEEIAAQIEGAEQKIAVMVGYDYDVETWVVVAVDSTNGKLKVDTT